MEFRRFGSIISGSYWGCCACTVIQNFNVDPDAKSSIQMVYGDTHIGPEGGAPTPCIDRNAQPLFAGPTYRDIFLQRIRVGTHGVTDMPNHTFLAIMTASQMSNTNGKKWLKLLKQTGFEFIRALDNSVYNGPELNGPELAGKGSDGNPHPNYLFGLFRNIGRGRIVDPFTPPKAWTDLPEVVPEAWEALVDHAFEGGQDGKDLAAKQTRIHTEIWNKIGPAKLLTEAEVRKAGAPVILSGTVGKKPLQKPEKAEVKERSGNRTYDTLRGHTY